MKWWAAGLSVMATQISAITFVGTTGQAYTQGMSFLVVYLGLPIAMVVLCMTLVPFFYRSGVFTAYEYLEKRFDSRTRTLTSLLFLFSRSLAMGVTLYAPSLVLSVILGWSETATILIMGGTTILYVVHGGNKSVIWTDVVQMVIIWVGIFICAGVAIAKVPEAFSLRDSLAVAQLTNHLEMMDTSLDPSRPYTLWSGLIGGAFLAMAYFGADQSQVQRYLSARSLQESRLVAAVQRVPEGPDAVPDPAHRRAGVRLLPLRAAAAALERAGDAPAGARGSRDGGRGPAGRRFRPRTHDRQAAAADYAQHAERRGARGLPGGARARDAPSTSRRDVASRELSGAKTLQRHQLHLPVLRGLEALGRPGRPRDRGHLRGGHVDAGGRVQLGRHGHHGGLLPALRPPRRERSPTTSGCHASSRRSGAVSPAWSPCGPASSARRSRW